jgi:hypothetical protein
MRNRRPREIERAACPVQDDLHDIRIRVIGSIRDRHAHRRHLEHRIRDERGNDLLDHLRLDERLVTLDIQHDLAGETRCHFRDAIGARPMPCARHHRDAAEASYRRRNPLVVGGDDYRIDAARRGGASINMLDHGTAGDVGERFSRQTYGVVSSGDDGDDL